MIIQLSGVVARALDLDFYRIGILRLNFCDEIMGCCDDYSIERCCSACFEHLDFLDWSYCQYLILVIPLVSQD